MRSLGSTLALLAGCQVPTYEAAPPGPSAVPTDPTFADAGVRDPARGDTGRALLLGAPVTAEVAPPPIAGGTLAVDATRRIAVAADPDRDRVSVVDLSARAVLRVVVLPAGAEPGRVAIAPDGRAYVALRRAGAVASFSVLDDVAPTITPVCPAPRGLALDPAHDRMWVACAGGELLQRRLSTNELVRATNVGVDLRDVVVTDTSVYVTTFRDATVRQVDASTGEASSPVALPDDLAGRRRVAWRAVPWGNGIMVLAQRHSGEEVSVDDGGTGTYGQSDGRTCFPGVVRPSIARYGLLPGRDIELPAGLVVDLDGSPQGDLWAAVGPGDARTIGGNLGVFVGSTAPTGRCAPSVLFDTRTAGERVAVRFLGDDVLVVQSREPAFLELVRISAEAVRGVEGSAAVGRVALGIDPRDHIDLGGASRRDTGHELFHAAAGAGIACASCHPEGGDDGHVWNFSEGPRRTPSLRGGVSGTEPFHWDGSLRDFAHLSQVVFTGRMQGPTLDAANVDALRRWVDRVPLVPTGPAADVAAVARGAAIFHDAKVGCAGCHAGPMGTNNQTVDVGTGGAFQVPSLRGLWLRAPYQHDGCAATLGDRFRPGCRPDAHGDTRDLTDAARRDLVAYLETL